jgi:hypothetical protein
MGHFDSGARAMGLNAIVIPRQRLAVLAVRRHGPIRGLR